MYGIPFHRTTRIYPDRLPEGEVAIVPPQSPPRAQGGAMGIMQYILPAFGMLGSVVLIFAEGARPIMFVAVGGMMFASVGGGIIMGTMQRKSGKRAVKGARDKYLRYLEQQTKRLDDIAQRQQKANARLYPDLQTLYGYVAQKQYLWERRPTDDDFLRVRVGVGVEPLCVSVHMDQNDDPFAEYDQDLLARARNIIAKYSQLDDGPVSIPLRNIGTLAINGRRANTRALARSMICQMAAQQAPEDVRMLVYTPEDATAEWSWLKWLPHTRRLRLMKLEKNETAEPLCLLANSVEDFQRLLTSQVVPELERRRLLNADSKQQGSSIAKPHFVVVVDGFTPGGPLGRLPALDSLFNEAAQLGATVICLVDDRTAEPAAVQARIDVAETGWLYFEETVYGGQRREGIRPDAANVELCEKLARRLSPLMLSEMGAQSDLSQDMRLLELLGVASADDVRIGDLWQKRERPQMLKVPIGLCADGTPLILDVKEASEGGMGPHGLIIGATGSGKSELLRTIVTSLALTHDPETVNFVLADFKGGAAFADLAELPHTAGMISNLQSDLTLVDRMRAALFGEQERRQRMLREGGNLDNIQQYQAKRAMVPEMEPMPHLLIIVDEFAELLTSRPDFLELFVAIGRVGRSLGMHLLLATQRLSEGRIQGLEGHLRYRICLRTFSASESSSVIGTQDAFYLPSFPGIGYFKVDTNIYKQFKTALVSNPYVPASKNSATAITLREFTPTGKLAFIERPDTPAPSTAPNSGADALRTDMDVVIGHLVEQNKQRVSPPVHQVWLPPLGTQVPIREVLDLLGQKTLNGSAWPANPPFGSLRIPIGMVDKPLDQMQEPLVLDFSGAGGHLALAGAPQSGKSILLQSIIASFMLTHTPRDVQFYCVDLGGGLLRQLEEAPHVGAVCSKSEREKVRRLIHQVRTVIEDREFLFRERRIDSMATYRARRATGELDDVPFGDVFLVIDDLAQFNMELEGLEAEVIEIVLAGLAYGVHVIVASNRWIDIKPKLRDNIGARLELRLNDPIESEVGKAFAMTLPPGVAGRGLLKNGLQFQTALARADYAPPDQTPPQAQAVETLVNRTRASWKGPVAPPVRLLPALVPLSALPDPHAEQPAGVPIGLEEFQLAPLYIDLISAGPHFLIFGDGECGKTTLLRHWMQTITERYTPDEAQFVLVDYRRGLLDFLDSPHMLAYACTPPMLQDAVNKLKTQLDSRMLSSAHLTVEELRNPHKWSGPQYFLFVDDYESIVTPAGNPLAPLVELIGQARDVGFHLVLARRVSGTSRTSFEPVFQRLKESGSPGLIMTGDPQEGPLLGTQKASALPPGRGYLVRRNQRNTLVQTVFVEPVPV